MIRVELLSAPGRTNCRTAKAAVAKLIEQAWSHGDDVGRPVVEVANGGEEPMSAILTVTASELESKVLRAPGAVVLDLYQASCPPCRALEPRLDRIARQYKGRLPVYRTDIDRDMPIAERFGVKSIPTILMLRDGREVDRLDGLITDADLRRAFDRAVAP